MEDKQIVLIAALGFGAWLLLTQRAAAGQAVPVYRVPGRTATGAPAYPTAPNIAAAQEAAAYQGIGSLLAKIGRNVWGGIATPAGQTPPYVPSVRMPDMPPPDDSMAMNPPSSIDPYQAEIGAFGGFGGA